VGNDGVLESLISDSGFLPWRSRAVAGDGGDLGCRRRARPAARLDKGKYQRDLQGQGSTPVKRRGRGVVWDHRILRSLPAAMADSGEKFRRSGDVSRENEKGGRGRR
jgi:hypothetical protein